MVDLEQPPPSISGMVWDYVHFKDSLRRPHLTWFGDMYGHQEEGGGVFELHKRLWCTHDTCSCTELRFLWRVVVTQKKGESEEPAPSNWTSRATEGGGVSRLSMAGFAFFCSTVHVHSVHNTHVHVVTQGRSCALCVCEAVCNHPPTSEHLLQLTAQLAAMFSCCRVENSYSDGA